ncbi:4-hydroxyphenylacetaldehyde oxime monooxygenase [Bertholletia excelsa]
MDIFFPTPAWIIPLLVTLLFILSLRPLKTKKKLVEARLPPSPPRLTIIGNLQQLGKLPHHSLYQLSQKFGPIMLLQLGNVPALIISSPIMAKEVLRTRDLNFCTRPESPGPK